MEQHPVPQQISSYQFRLVGDMTLKQFFEVAGGIVLALICYGLPLPGIFKWPLVVIFVLLGGALAFVPIEERPLEDWIIAFLRSIYKPTLFYWKKPSVKPLYYYQPIPIQAAPGAPAETAQAQTEVQSDVEVQLENQEKNFFSRLTGLLNPLPSGKTVIPTTPAAQSQTATVANLTASPIQSMPPAGEPVGQVIITPTRATPKPQPTVAVPLVTEQVQKPAPEGPSYADQQKRPPVVPQLGNIKIEKQAPIQMPSTPPTQTVPTPINLPQNTQVFTPQQPTSSQSVQFSPEAMPPIPPTQPNIVVGQVMDAKGKIVEGAILEIQDTAGRPVRALKTNKAGHFLIVTPLANGSYDLIVDKQGLEFETLKFDARGEVIQPMSIRSKNEIANE